MTGEAGLTRRGLLAGAAGATAAAAAAGAPDASARRRRRKRRRPRPSADWSLPARNLGATRHAPAAPRGTSERWRLTLAGGVPGPAAVAGGIVYAASYGGEVVAASLTTGRELWRSQFPTATYGDALTGTREVAFFGGPAVSGRRVVVASDRVRCLHASTGATLWEAPPLRTNDSDDYFWGAPAIAGGVVLAGSGSGSELPRARGKVTAYRLRDGALLWSAATVPEGGNGGGVIAQVTVDEPRGSVYAATGSPYERVEGANPGTCSFLELRLADGSLRYADQVHPGDADGLDFNSAPALAGRRAFATAKDGVYAWDRIARRRLWHTRLTPATVVPGVPAGPANGPEGGPVATDGRRVYALSNDMAAGSHVAAALDPRDGGVLWRTTLPAVAFAAPAVVGDALVSTSASGLLTVLDAATGSVRATAPLGEPSAGAVSSARGYLLAGTGTEPYLPGESLVCLG